MSGEGPSYLLAMRKDERQGKKSLRAELEYPLNQQSLAHFSVANEPTKLGFSNDKLSGT